MKFNFKKQISFYLIFILFFTSVQINAKAPVLTRKEIANPPPRIIRTCCGFGANIGVAGVPFYKKTDITSVAEMGPHGYLGGKYEHNGNIYTKRGGFLDLGHLRDCADWTAYLYNLIKACEEDREWVITNLGNEGGSKTLVLRLPENFNDNMACELAGKIAYDLSVWHEISTWFGASYVPLVPERFSSFSPEDLYSNLLGVELAKRAIKSDMEYNEAMTFMLNEMMDSLEAVTTWDETYDAMVKVDQLWYTSEKRYPNKKLLLKRHFNSETNIVPWLVPGEESFLPPYILDMPDQNLSDLFQLSIDLNFRFPVKMIFSEESDRIITQNDFDAFIDYIQDQLHTLDAKEENKANRLHKRRDNKIDETSSTN